MHRGLRRASVTAIGAIAAAHVGHVAIGCPDRPSAEQRVGPAVEPVAGEDAAVGREVELEIGQPEGDDPPGRTRGRSLAEVLLAGHETQGRADILAPMPHQIRVFGDPVLKTTAAEVTDIDGKVVTLADEMLDVMYAAPGLGLAAPQIGIQRQLFVYDLGDDPRAIVNPTIKESRGEWVYDEGCLSIPNLYVEIARPKEILLAGWDLDGNEIEIEADDLMARLFQHELDHLNGVLMFDRMEADQRREALARMASTTGGARGRVGAEASPPPRLRPSTHGGAGPGTGSPASVGVPRDARDGGPAVGGPRGRRVRGGLGRDPRRRSPGPGNSDLPERGEGRRHPTRAAGRSRRRRRA